MAEILASGDEPTPDAFGGFEAVVADLDALRHSLFSPEFLDMAVRYEPERPETSRLISEVLSSNRDDIVMNRLVDRADILRLLRRADQDRVFREWTSIAADRARAASLRTAVMRGALLLACADSRRALSLAARVAEFEPDDEPYVLAHAARIAGLLDTVHEQVALSEFLVELTKVDDAADEAFFELGMKKVREALSLTTTAEVLERLGAAKALFEQAVALRDARYDARVFATCIELFIRFHNRATAVEVSELVDGLGVDCFAYVSYCTCQSEAGPLQAKAAEVAAWTAMSMRLKALTADLEQVIWLDALTVIERNLLVAYSCNRTIFGRDMQGGLEAIVRPRIEEEVLASEPRQLFLRHWLKGKPDHGLGPAAGAVLAAIERSLEQPIGHPTQAAGGESPAAELTTDLDAQTPALKEAFASAWRFEMMSIAPPIPEIMETINEEFSGLPDFTSPRVRGPFLALCLETLKFLVDRCNVTAHQDEWARYLFAEHCEKPVEKDLQQDFMRFFRRSSGVEEISGIGGGRADVVYQAGAVRLVIEVKREQSDASFAALIASYGEQASMYQNTNVCLGILLVLDLTSAKKPFGHLRSLCKPARGDFLGDGVERGLLIVRVPAGRITPSTATRTASQRAKAARAATK